jgi:serine/threonine protein phosphatase PrpC
MNCPECGTDNREGANFCRMCGAELSSVPTTSEPAQPVSDLEAPEKERQELQELEVLAGSTVEEEAGDSTEEIEPDQGEPEAEPEAAEVALEAPLEPAETVTEPTGESAGTADETAIDESGAILDEEPVASLDEAELGPLADSAGGESRPPEASVETIGTVPPDLEAAAEGEDVATGVTETDAEAPASESELEEPPPELSQEPEADETPGDFEGYSEVEVEETELVTPVEPGTVIDSRYLLVEAEQVGETEILYLAQDLLSCWQCGFEGNLADDSFCAQCGAALDRRPEVRLLEVLDEEAEPSSEEEAVAHIVDNGRHFWLLAEPEPEPEEVLPVPEMRLVVGHRSHTGQVRELNEDSILIVSLAPTYESRTGPVLGIFAVADGMGGHEGGEIASKLALQVLADRVLRKVFVPEITEGQTSEAEITSRLHQATVDANDAVYLARQKRGNDMGTTLTAALVRDDQLFLAHVGDCRAYRWNADGLRQLTADHSLVASMIASGQAEPQEIYTHPHRSVIFRCIGDQPLVEVDTEVQTLLPDDRLIVCSDGLWEMVRAEGIEDVMMQEPDPQMACDLLVTWANAAGGDDNISVIIVQVEAT